MSLFEQIFSVIHKRFRTLLGFSVDPIISVDEHEDK